MSFWLHLREKKNPLKCARSMARTVQLLRHDAYPVLLMLKSRLLIANEVREICHSHDLIKDFFHCGVCIKGSFSVCHFLLTAMFRPPYCWSSPTVRGLTPSAHEDQKYEIESSRYITNWRHYRERKDIRADHDIQKWTRLTGVANPSL